MSFAAASTLACGSRPDRIWIKPTRKVELLPVAVVINVPRPGDAPAQASGRVRRQQRIELAGTIQRVQLIAAADVGFPDEDLRHRVAAARAPHHLVAPLR